MLFWTSKKRSQTVVDMVPIPSLTPDLRVFADDGLQRNVQLGRWGLHGSALLMGGCVVAVICIFSYLIAYRSEILNREVSVYFDIKAIDGAGHPVSGATVKSANRNLGTTDSFGEWRSYLNLKSRSSFTLHISKKLREGEISVSKNFVVPLTPSHSLAGNSEHTIKQTIAMLGDKLPVPKEVAVQSVDTIEVKPDPVASITSSETKAAVKAATPGIKIEVRNSGSDSLMKNTLQSIASHLTSEIEQAGMNVSEHAAVTVNLGALTGSRELFVVDVKTPSQSYKVLRNIIADKLAIAKQIGPIVMADGTLQSQLQKRGWRSYKFELKQTLPRDMQIFVMGYAADMQGKSVQYWAPNPQSANLTVVNENKIILRQRIAPASFKALQLPGVVVAKNATKERSL